jgi:hypothetical protein
MIALAASRLALRAPALRVGTTLTQPNRSAQRLPCDRQVVPRRQLFGYGRGDRSSNLMRGLISKKPAGFRSRQGTGNDQAPVTAHNALFLSYNQA